MQFTTNWSRISGMIALMLSVAACADVLGIDEAHIDPGLTPGPATGGGAIDAGTGGSSGSPAAETGPSGGGGAGGSSGAPSIDSGNPAETGPDSGDSPLCRQYCSDIMDYCNGDLKQYVDVPQCLKICALYPEGAITDSDGNTAACRLKYAGKARYASGSERDAYCRKAGPGSEGTCGTICDGFCALMMAACTPKFAPYNYSSVGDCLNACRVLKDTPPYTVSDGTLPDRNDAQCRLFHVCSAVMDPDEHCEHAMGVTMCDPKGDAGHVH
ncbi:MAG TPA: hypothetical protein VK550_07100 [Polyangiaceae bacterium]|nr:hypothetical protein [Polyangiaceae bacterium]